MPFFWPSPTIHAFGSGQQSPFQIDDRIAIQAAEQRFQRDSNLAVFRGGVVATYGVTQVFADEIVFLLPTGEERARGLVRSAKASGHVKVVDPDGTIRADLFEFDWHSGLGTALNCEIEVADMVWTVGRLDLKPGEWKLTDVSAQICQDEPLEIACRSLVYKPRKTAVLTRFQLRVANRTVIGLPGYSRYLGPNERATMFPNLVLGGERGLGVSWAGKYEITDSIALRTTIGTATKSNPWGSAYLVYSFLPDGKTPSPASDTSEVNSRGFFESINVRSPEDALRSSRTARSSISLGTSFRQGRYEDFGGAINKPFEAIAEWGGDLGGWGVLGQVRYHRLDQSDANDLTRLTSQASISAPSWALAPGLAVLARLDARSYRADTGLDGYWVRGQIGILGALGPIKLGLAWSEASQMGDEPLSFESLSSLSTFHVRADTQFGPTKLGFLAKYDRDRNEWYDHEYFVSQLAGCLEPFVSYRDHPRRLQLGLSFRPLQKLERLEAQTSKRLPGNHFSQDR